MTSKEFSFFTARNEIRLGPIASLPLRVLLDTLNCDAAMRKGRMRFLRAGLAPRSASSMAHASGRPCPVLATRPSEPCAGARILLVAEHVFLLACGSMALQTDLASVRRGIARESRQEVQVRAAYRGSIECLPCPEEGGVAVPCQPCADVLILSETPDSPDEEGVHVAGRAAKLVAGRTHCFHILRCWTFREVTTHVENGVRNDYNHDHLRRGFL
jgi:hypothetical protein